MKGKHLRNSRKNIIIFLLILIVLLIIILVNKINTYKPNSKSVLEDIIIDEKQITETITERMLKVKELKRTVNKEIVGWLEIENTKINFPVVQGVDNDYYIRHDYKNEYSFDGAIFLDKSFNWNKPSNNYLIYGHNNKNGNMFQDLLNYKEKSYYLEHPTIRFTTVDDDSEYEIISIFLSRVYYKSEKNVFRYYYFIDAKNEEEYNSFVRECKNASLYDTGKTAEYGDQLLTLSTCEYSQEDGRFVVVARKKTN